MKVAAQVATPLAGTVSGFQFSAGAPSLLM